MPIVVTPSLKVTVPVAVSGETVAVKVTAVRTRTGSAGRARVVVLAWMVAETTWETAEDVEVR